MRPRKYRHLSIEQETTQKSCAETPRPESSDNISTLVYSRHLRPSAVVDPLDRVDFASPYATGLAHWDTILTCPMCGCDCNHPHAVVVNRGGRVDEIRGDANVRQVTTFPTGRGSSVWLEYVCESGHLWTLQLQFHKGNLYVACGALRSFDVGNGANWPTTFWRD